MSEARGWAIVVALAALMLVARSAAAAPGLEGVPRFAHILVIIEENKEYDEIVGGVAAPNIARLARAYGNATRFYGETHPSEGNYVALLGGDTDGIRDDDAWFCKPGTANPACPAERFEKDYPDHTVHGPGLNDQLVAAGLTWKAYMEDLPAPGSLAYVASRPPIDDGTIHTALYASKHAGFVNFASVQDDPRRADRLVGFDRLNADLASGRLPNFALIVPNQCNEMHGLVGPHVPADCLATNTAALISRGDAETARLVAAIQATTAWRSRDNTAIVITFDEGAAGERTGCCIGPPNLGGGHIPTIVITNHGPRGLTDATPYNHYSLLRTIEDAFGIASHLRHAADSGAGVLPMARLFGGE
jgi:phospholipase C